MWVYPPQQLAKTSHLRARASAWVAAHQSPADLMGRPKMSARASRANGARARNKGLPVNVTKELHRARGPQ